MKIISPIDDLVEVDGLIEAGAGELYGGYIPDAWQQRFGLLTSINQRTFDTAQISSRSDLSEIIAATHSAGLSFSLTLNAPFYSDVQLPLLLDFVADIVDAGVDGIILADLSLLRTLKKHFPELEFHASTLAHLGNSLAVETYSSAGIDRVIFPRHIPVEEMADMIRACPDVVFDAFMLVGKCPNTEGLCTFHHSSSDKVWPCEIPYNIESLAEHHSPKLESVISRQASWSVTNRRHGCGLCAIPQLAKAGVSGVKLVGRGAPTGHKISNILLVRDFINLAASVPDFDEYRKMAVSAHKERFGSECSPNICYYPEYYLTE